VDEKLEQIMINIYHNIDDAARRYGMEGNYVAGANIAGFEKVANASRSIKIKPPPEKKNPRKPRFSGGF